MISKLEKLNDLDCDNVPTDVQKVKNILGEVLGQISGNRHLKLVLSEDIEKIKKFIQKTVIKETHKRTIIFEIKEKIRTLDVELYNKTSEEMKNE